MVSTSSRLYALPYHTSVCFAKPREIGHVAVAVEVLVVSLGGQDARGKTLLVAPLGRALRVPSPVPPPPTLFEGDHLCLREHLQKLLVGAAILARISVRAVAGARAIFRGAEGGKSLRGGVAGVVGARPSVAPAHVGQVLGAVRVSLGPLGEHGWPEAGRRVHALLRLLCPAVAGVLHLLLVRVHDLVVVEDHVLVHVQHQPVHPRQLALPVREPHEAVPEHHVRRHPVLAHQVVRFRRPGDDGVRGEGHHARLVGEPVEGDDVLVPVLREELGQAIVHVEGPLAVQVTVGAVEPVDDALSSAVIPPVLTTR